MLSPNELIGARFDRSAFGYRTEQVDKYVTKVGEAIAALTEENRELEEKLEILASKLEEYRSDEESLRTALLGAQKLGDSVIRESKNKAEIIVRDATVRAERIIESAQAKINREQQTLNKIQKEVSDFKNKMLAMYKHHLETIANIPDNEGDGYTAEIPSVNTPVIEAVQDKDIKQNETERVYDIQQEKNQVLDQETKAEPKPQKPSRFGELQFGEEFSLNNTPFMKK